MRSLADGVVNAVEERRQVRFLAVAGDRHVRRRDIEPDKEFLVLGRLGDGLIKSATECDDVALVAIHRQFGGDRRAVDADQKAALIGLRSPDLDGVRNDGAWLGAELRFAVRDRVSRAGKGVGTDGAEALWADRLARVKNSRETSRGWQLGPWSG